MCLDFGTVTSNFIVTERTNVEFTFWMMTEKAFRVTIAKFGTYSHQGSGQIPIAFGVVILNFNVTECKKVKLPSAQKSYLHF